MNRFNRLIRRNENSANSQRNFNNIQIHSHTPQFEGRSDTNLNRRILPLSNSSNSNRNDSPLVSNSDIGNYEIDSLNSVSLDPSGQINELCIANITNSCKFGKHCRFIHGKSCSLCKENVYNPLEDLADQMIEHSKICKKMNLDKKEVKESSTDEEEEEINYTCSICLENIVPPMKFGVLCNCNHYFCYECIKIWRNSQDFSDINNHLKCPLCKTKSQFLIPSKEFPKTDKERDMLITKYRQELANTECKKLRDTNYKYCPYGDNCIYSHYKPNGQYMHFTYMTDANQFISPEEYDQNIFQNDTTGFIQYYNNRLIEETLLADDGDDFGMHNGVFTNPFYHSDDSFDNISLFNNLMPNPDGNPNLGFYSPIMHGSEINNIPLEYMFDDVTNHINTLNINQYEEESNEDNDNISDINDSEISDYLEEIDEDLNLYYMMNNNRNRNLQIPSIISGSNNGSTNNNNIEGRSPASIFSSTSSISNPGVPHYYRQRRELNSRIRGNNNIANENNSNSNFDNTTINNTNTNNTNYINTTTTTTTTTTTNNNNNNNNHSTESHQNNDRNTNNNNYDITQNNNTENTFNLSLIRNTSSQNDQSNINSLNRSTLSHDDYSVQSSLSTLQRILGQEANSNDSFNTFGINDEDSRNLSQLSLSRNSGMRNTILTSLTELTNNDSSTSNILNNIGIINDSTLNRSSSNIIINDLNTFGRKVKSDISRNYNNSSTNKISGQHNTDLEPSSSVNKSSNNQNLSHEQSMSSNIKQKNKESRNDSSSSNNTKSPITSSLINDSSTSNSQERLPNRYHINKQNTNNIHERTHGQQSNISSKTRNNKEKYTQYHNHNQYINNNDAITNNNNNNSSIDMSRLNVIKTKEIKRQETGLVNDQTYSYKNYKKNDEDFDSDSSGEIEDVIVRSTSGYVDYAELSDEEFNELYMETKL
ncbi:hypothetical protein H8356DRAFT_944825 [Neocallimastix lanati (nom. inval.)]|nr:hypothetical protein H8356DRAFT_944825 [Neocallimastix sp. JGI-2020a]